MENALNDASTAEILAAVMWLVRDFVVPLALLLAVFGLFSRRDWVNAVMVWVLGLLGTLVTLSDSDKQGLLNIPTELAVLGVLLTAALLVIGYRRNRPIFKSLGRRQVAYERAGKSYKSQSSSGRAQAQAGKRTEVPACSKCGAPMVLRVAKSGTNKGSQFYGCSNYPQCRGTRPVP